VVAVTFDPDAPTITGYRTDGSTIELHLRDSLPAAPLLILHPEERKLERVAPQASTSGAVIQDAHDGTETGSVALANGVPVGAPLPPDGSVQPALVACDPNAIYCEEPPVVISPSPTTPGIYLAAFKSHEGDGWFGSLELEFHPITVSGFAQYPSSPNAPYGKFVVWSGNTCTYTPYTRNAEKGQWYSDLRLLVANQRLTTPAPCTSDGATYYFTMTLIEDDGGANFDDDMFGRRYFYPGSSPYGAVANVNEWYRRNTFGDTTAEIRLENR
jgi:hypothetical protein